MNLNTFWFVLIAILYAGFFLLEGFDYGVGMLLPILGRAGDVTTREQKRRTMINAIGPFWDGNEVWLITAGGATFAAFPHWYATLFSGFYLPLIVILLALILRGAAFEFRSKLDQSKWHQSWDWGIFYGSLIPAFLFGVAFTNLARGIAIDVNMQYVGGLVSLLNPPSLLGGLAATLTFSLHGALFLTLRTDGELSANSRNLALKLWIPAFIIMLLVTILLLIKPNPVLEFGNNWGRLPLVVMLVSLLLVGIFIHRKREAIAFVMTSISIICSLLTLFITSYPRVMVSSLDPTFSLTVYNASSSPYTLKVMSIVAIVFVPLVLVYQGWSYWIFRKRLSGKPETLHY